MHYIIDLLKQGLMAAWPQPISIYLFMLLLDISDRHCKSDADCSKESICVRLYGGNGRICMLL